VFIVKKRDTGKTNALKEEEGTKSSSNWSDGANVPLEPMVTLQLGSKSVQSLCDTGIAYSVIKKAEGPLSKEKLSIQGATGTQQDYHWSEGQITNLGGGTITHSFLVIPDCPYPLLG
jgi:hypothetical protein